MGLYRRFTFSNIEFIEVTQSIDGTPLVDTDKCVFIADDGDGQAMPGRHLFDLRLYGAGVAVNKQ